MEVRPHRIINRKITKEIKVGNVKVGVGETPRFCSINDKHSHYGYQRNYWTNYPESAGADIVRVFCPDESSTRSLRDIIKEVNVPIVADIHFHYKRAIEAAKVGASCLRINPGNIGSKDRIMEVIKAAKDNNCSIRIGVNAGSLDKVLLKNIKNHALRLW